MSDLESMSEILSTLDITRLIRQVWDYDVELVDYKITPYSKEKLGFLATIYSVFLKVQDINTNEIKTEKLFIKSKPHDNMIGLVDEMGIFEKEIVVYNEVFPLMKEGFVGENWAPVCYMVTEECLIFEDLREKGFSLRNKILTKEELTSVLSSLARMHAAAIIAEKKLGRPLDQAFPKAFDSSYFFDGGKWTQWIKAGINLGTVLANQMNLDGDKFRTICEHWPDGLFSSETKQNVFCHADMWSNNFMFNNNDPPKCVLLDYQIARYGPLIHDVFFMLYQCSTREFRNKHEKQLVRHYYTILCETLRNNKQSSCVPPWSEVTHGTEKIRLSIAILAMFYFPTSNLTGEKVAHLFQDSESMMNFIFKDRVDAVLAMMKQDKVYDNRIRESVNEVFELGSSLGY